MGRQLHAARTGQQNGTAVWEMGHGVEGAVGVGHGLLFQVLLNSYFAQTHMPQAFEWVTYLTTELFKWGQG